MVKILICGSGGFIGGHLVRRFRNAGHWVCGVDLTDNKWFQCDRFHQIDLRDMNQAMTLFDPNDPFDEIYQLAADMGGAEYLFTGDNDADIMANSVLINLNILRCIVKSGHTNHSKIFYSSSACIYPERNQMDPDNPVCSESSAYPAEPDSEYGWEKLFSERLYANYAKNHGIQVRIARFHNIFGPYGTYTAPKAKAPAALCRKIATVSDGETIDVIGDGLQTRSFLYIDECIEGYSSRPQLHNLRRLPGFDAPERVRNFSYGRKKVDRLPDPDHHQATARFSDVERSFSILKIVLSIPQDL